MKTFLTALGWLALGVLIAVPATAWYFGAGAKTARQLTFQPDGTDLKATDVDNAIRELSQKVKQVETGQAALQGAALVQQSQIGEVKVAVAESDEQTKGRIGTLETRVAEAAAPRRRIEYTEGSDTSSVNARYQPLRDLGGFTKTSPNTAVVLTWNTHVDAMGEPGTFCDFQIRVDGKPDSDREGGGGRAVVYVPPNAGGGSSPVTVATIFNRVGAGHHTVSIWVRGTARECMENYGNFPRSVIIEEGPRLE